MIHPANTGRAGPMRKILAPMATMGFFALVSATPVSAMVMLDSSPPARTVSAPAGSTSPAILFDGPEKLPSDVPLVPEPAVWALLVAGFGAVGGIVRARRHGPISRAD